MGQAVLKAKYHINATVKKALYKMIFGKKINFGKGVTFRKNFNLCVEEQGSLKIGNNTFFNNGCSLNVLSGLSIGSNCVFGENVKIYDHNHKFRDTTQPIKNQGFTKSSISIGDDCWIASNVTILKGVKIGNRCVIGANCLVYKDVPDNTIVKNKTELIFEKI